MKLMVIGFPKAGTTTLTHALNASGLKSAHWHAERHRLVGERIYSAVLEGLDPFAHLAGFDAVTQADVCAPSLKFNFWPNLDFAILRAIRRAHPTCLFVLNYRRAEDVAESMINWMNFQSRLIEADIPGLPAGMGAKRSHLIRWVENHYDACRAYFADDEYFLEINIEDPDAPKILGQRLGMEIVGWGKYKPSRLGPDILEDQDS